MDLLRDEGWGFSLGIKLGFVIKTGFGVFCFLFSLISVFPLFCLLTCLALLSICGPLGWKLVRRGLREIPGTLIEPLGFRIGVVPVVARGKEGLATASVALFEFAVGAAGTGVVTVSGDLGLSLAIVFFGFILGSRGLYWGPSGLACSRGSIGVEVWLWLGG